MYNSFSYSMTYRAYKFRFNMTRFLLLYRIIVILTNSVIFQVYETCDIIIHANSIIIKKMY